MKSLHPDLAGGRWQTMTLVEQLGNIGSEVGRVLRAHARGDEESVHKSLDRALELFWFTAEDPKNRGARLREVLRAREVVLDYLFGGNQYQSTATSIDAYFMDFGLAANRERRHRAVNA